MMNSFFFSLIRAVKGLTAVAKRSISELGNSITAASDEYYLNPIAAELGMTPVNGGIPGSALSVGATQMIYLNEEQHSRFRDYIRPDGIYIVEAGINDLGGGVDIGWFSQHYEKLVQELLLHYAPQDIILCLIAWCVPGTLTNPTYTLQKHNDFNNVIAGLASEYGTKLCDFYTPFVDRADLLPDGLHPNPAGYELRKQTLLAVI